MKLTAYTNYALRILIYCALREPRLSSVPEIAEAYGISKAHLVKAAHQMVQIGYLTSVRGRSGGIRLAMAPEEIIVGQVVRHTEGDLDLVECFNPDINTCPLMEVCELSQTMKRARDAFLDVLDQKTLADITRNHNALAIRLDLFADA